VHTNAGTNLLNKRATCTPMLAQPACTGELRAHTHAGTTHTHTRESYVCTPMLAQYSRFVHALSTCCQASPVPSALHHLVLLALDEVAEVIARIDVVGIRAQP